MQIVIQFSCALSPTPFTTPAGRDGMTIFFSVRASMVPYSTRIHHLWTESSHSMFVKISYIWPTIKKQKSLSHHFGNYIFFFPAALLSLKGKFSKGDSECDWGVSSWHLWITKIVGAAGGATAGNGSLIFLDVKRQDPFPDSPQLEKAHSADVNSASNWKILSPKLAHI